MQNSIVGKITGSAQIKKIENRTLQSILFYVKNDFVAIKVKYYDEDRR